MNIFYISLILHIFDKFQFYIFYSVKIMKPSKLKVFVDTSIFVNQNFLAGKYIKQLLELGEKDKVEIYITDIIYNEILSNYKSRMESGYEIVRKNLKEINKDANVFRQHPEYDYLYNCFKPDKDNLFKEFKKQLDDILSKGKVNILPSKGLIIDGVIDKYFKRIPPFSEKKKSEFPDAFSLEIVERFMAKKAGEIYVLTTDSDLKEHISSKLKPLPDIPTFLDINNKHQHKIELITRIESIFEDQKDSVLENAERQLLDFLESGAWEEFPYLVSNVSDIDIINSEFSENYSITDINERDACIETQLSIEVKIDFTIDNYENASHDNEDDTWYFVEQEERSKTLKMELPITINIDYNPPAGPRFPKVKIKEIDFYLLVESENFLDDL